jgi:hypothetical protein
MLAQAGAVTLSKRFPLTTKAHRRTELATFSDTHQFSLTDRKSSQVVDLQNGDSGGTASTCKWTHLITFCCGLQCHSRFGDISNTASLFLANGGTSRSSESLQRLLEIPR